MKKLLVPVDGSEPALRAVDAAVSLAKLLNPGASIHLVHCHEEPMYYGEIAVYTTMEKIQALQQEHSEAILTRAEARVKDAGLPCTREVLVGPIGLTIARHAEASGCDGIVMGRHGRTAIGDIVVGSVTMKVLHASKLPVLTVR